MGAPCSRAWFKSAKTSRWRRSLLSRNANQPHVSTKSPAIELFVNSLGERSVAHTTDVLSERARAPAGAIFATRRRSSQQELSEIYDFANILFGQLTGDLQQLLLRDDAHVFNLGAWRFPTISNHCPPNRSRKAKPCPIRDF